MTIKVNYVPSEYHGLFSWNPWIRTVVQYPRRFYTISELQHHIDGWKVLEKL